MILGIRARQRSPALVRGQTLSGGKNSSDMFGVRSAGEKAGCGFILRTD